VNKNATTSRPRYTGRKKVIRGGTIDVRVSRGEIPRERKRGTSRKAKDAATQKAAWWGMPERTAGKGGKPYCTLI